MTGRKRYRRGMGVGGIKGRRVECRKRKWSRNEATSEPTGPLFFPPFPARKRCVRGQVREQRAVRLMRWQKFGHGGSVCGPHFWQLTRAHPGPPPLARTGPPKENRHRCVPGAGSCVPSSGVARARSRKGRLPAPAGEISCKNRGIGTREREKKSGGTVVVEGGRGGDKKVKSPIPLLCTSCPCSPPWAFPRSPPLP